MSDEQKNDTAEIDVRTLPRSQRHRTVFEAYEHLVVDEALVLINDHEPKGLQEEFERELAGAHNWEPETLQTTPTASASPSWLAPHYPASSQTPLHYLQAPIPPLAARFGSWNQVPETKTPISSRYQPMMKSVCTSAQILMCSFLCFKVPVSSTPNATLSN